LPPLTEHGVARDAAGAAALVFPTLQGDVLLALVAALRLASQHAQAGTDGHTGDAGAHNNVFPKLINASFGLRRSGVALQRTARWAGSA
jgi:hypothetical protein